MSGPLSGIRVLDCSAVVTGPFCTMLMGDLGADVIKIESATGDLTRQFSLTFRAGVGSFFVGFNRNKRSIVFDLKHPEARQAILRMVAQSDVFIHNFRPGVMERLGLDYTALQPHNPKLVYLSITGFGDEGPYAQKPCFDPVIQAMSGVAVTQGGKDRPTFVRMALADKMTSMNAIYHILAALLAAERLGTGQEIKLSMIDSLLSFIGPDCMFGYTFIPDDEFKHLSMADAAVQPITTKDGYITTIAITNDQWKGLCQAIGKPEWIAQYPMPSDRAQHLVEIAATLDATMPQKTTKEWVTILEAAGVPCGPVYKFDEVLQDPQLLQNHTFVEYDHPVAGRIRGVNVPGKFSATPTHLRYPAPGLGQHTTEVLQEFGFSPAQTAALLEAKAATQGHQPTKG